MFSLERVARDHPRIAISHTQLQMERVDIEFKL